MPINMFDHDMNNTMTFPDDATPAEMQGVAMNVRKAAVNRQIFEGGLGTIGKLAGQLTDPGPQRARLSVHGAAGMTPEALNAYQNRHEQAYQFDQKQVADANELAGRTKIEQMRITEQNRRGDNAARAKAAEPHYGTVGNADTGFKVFMATPNGKITFTHALDAAPKGYRPDEIVIGPGGNVVGQGPAVGEFVKHITAQTEKEKAAAQNQLAGAGAAEAMRQDRLSHIPVNQAEVGLKTQQTFTSNADEVLKTAHYVNPQAFLAGGGGGHGKQWSDAAGNVYMNVSRVTKGPDGIERALDITQMQNPDTGEFRDVPQAGKAENEFHYENGVRMPGPPK